MTPSDPPTAERPAPAAPSYWLMSLGPKAEKWDECYDEGIACIGWDHLGNLEQYEDRKQMQLGRSDSLACWQFSREMKAGDFIFAKRGTTRVLGHGTVQSDYRFDDTRPEFTSLEWLLYSAGSPTGVGLPREYVGEARITHGYDPGMDNPRVDKLRRRCVARDRAYHTSDPTTPWVYHTNPACWAGKRIPAENLRGGYGKRRRQCLVC